MLRLSSSETLDLLPFWNKELLPSTTRFKWWSILVALLGILIVILFVFQWRLSRYVFPQLSIDQCDLDDTSGWHLYSQAVPCTLTYIEDMPLDQLIQQYPLQTPLTWRTETKQLLPSESEVHYCNAELCYVRSKDEGVLRLGHPSVPEEKRMSQGADIKLRPHYVVSIPRYWSYQLLDTEAELVLTHNWLV